MHITCKVKESKVGPVYKTEVTKAAQMRNDPVSLKAGVVSQAEVR